MKILFALAIVAALGAVYFIWLRPYLKSLPQFAEVWASEETTWTAIKVYFDGRKTLLTGMWGELIATGPDLLQIVSGVDLKTAFNLPDNWAMLIGGILVPTLMLIFRTRA